MFSNYLYTSSTSKVFRGHFVNAAKKYIKDLKLNKKNSYVIISKINPGNVLVKPIPLNPITIRDNSSLKNLISLNKFNIDEEIWKVTNFKVNQWDVSAKEEVDGKIFWNTHTNYQANASLVRKKPVKCDFPTVQGANVSKLKFNISIPETFMPII